MNKNLCLFLFQYFHAEASNFTTLTKHPPTAELNVYWMFRRSRKNYIGRPDVVERIGSYLGTSFPLFHGPSSEYFNLILISKYNHNKWILLLYIMIHGTLTYQKRDCNCDFNFNTELSEAITNPFINLLK